MTLVGGARYCPTYGGCAYGGASYSNPGWVDRANRYSAATHANQIAVCDGRYGISSSVLANAQVIYRYRFGPIYGRSF